MSRVRPGLFIILTITFMVASCNDPNIPNYKNAQLPVNDRIDDLLARMTVEEKAAQLIGSSDRDEVDGYKMLIDENGNFDDSLALLHFPYGLGHINRSSFLGDAKRSAVFCNQMQHLFKEKTRLGIPVLCIEEALHGHMADGATSFPSTVALASSWNRELVEKIYSLVASEVRIRGGNTVLSPVLDVGREPRWGRFEETFGEDPYLVSEMGLAAIRGFQGRNLPIDSMHVAATMKHFAAHGQPESGLNASPPNADERTLHEILLPAFKKAVTEANVMLTMASYNEINGIPSHINRWLLRDLLRNEWGFKGIVISDGGGIHDLLTKHRVAADEGDAAVKAFRAGVEMELPGRDFYKFIPTLVKEGKIDEKILDEAVSHILYVKFQLGLFENPFTNPEKADQRVGSEENRKLALEAAHQSIVLLKNENQLLPLSISGKTIAVIGPNADVCILGGYSKEPRQKITPLQAIREKAGKQANIVYAKGCGISKGPGNWFADEVALSDPKEDALLIKEAIQVAQKADVILLFLGENESVAREGWAVNHRGDKASLDLVGMQNHLVKEMLKLNKPVVSILLNNGPLTIRLLKEKIPALLECWYLGQETGYAIADVLFGKVNPSGKLPASIPLSEGHLPVFYNYKSIARRGYNFVPAEPLYPFGFGLSYTTFEYTKPIIEKNKIHPGEKVNAYVTVTNKGNRAGDEIVQMYVHDPLASVTRPVKELKDFCRIHLEPGESKKVQFTITPDKLSFYNIDMVYGVEPGLYEILIGTSSVDLQKVDLQVSL